MAAGCRGAGVVTAGVDAGRATDAGALCLLFYGLTAQRQDAAVARYRKVLEPRVEEKKGSRKSLDFNRNNS